MRHVPLRPPESGVQHVQVQMEQNTPAHRGVAHRGQRSRMRGLCFRKCCELQSVNQVCRSILIFLRESLNRGE